MRSIKSFMIVATLILMAAMQPALVTAQSTPIAATPLLDLPAAVLTPGEAEKIGIAGLGRFENGHFRSLAEYSQIRSDFLRIPFPDVESSLAEAGYLQGYTSNLGIPGIPGDPESPPSRVVFSSVYQYESTSGAEAAFALNTQYDAVTIATIDSSLTPATPIGDQAVMTRTTSATMEEEGPSDQIDTLFRIGNVIAATGIVDYGMSVDEIASPGPDDPGIKAQVEKLAAILIEHIEAELAGTGPQLWNKSLSLVAEDSDLAWTSTGYRRIDGVDIPYYNGYEDDFTGLASPEMIAAYEVAQPLGDPRADPFDPYFASRVYMFSSAEDASQFLEGIEEVQGAESMLLPEAAAQIGSEAKVIQYDFEVEPGLVALGYQVFQQSGSLVSMFLLESADHRPDLQVVLDLAGLQADCMQHGCEAPHQLPPSW